MRKNRFADIMEAKLLFKGISTADDTVKRNLMKFNKCECCVLWDGI